MSIENLVHYWHRPRSQEEGTRWEQLEQILNARLLDGRERTDALRLQRSGKDVFDAGLRWIDGVFEWLYGVQQRQQRSVYFPGKAYIDQDVALFTILVGLSLLSTIPILGAACAGYELYRVADRIVHKARRPTYYETESRKRHDKILAQRSQSHRIRHRTSILYPPAPSELLEMWEKASTRGNVRDKLRFGAMVALVEAVVNNDLIRDETGAIKGRNPGVRGWLKVNCPELLPHYKSVMHYKAMSDKEQAVCGLPDPYPAEVLFAEPFPMAENGSETADEKENVLIEIMVGPKSCWSEKRGRKEEGERVEITVGPEIGNNAKVVLRGVRRRMGEWLRREEKSVGNTVSCARKSAANLHAEAQTSNALSSLKQFEDILFSRLGLVREIRVRPRKSFRKHTLCPRQTTLHAIEQRV